VVIEIDDGADDADADADDEVKLLEDGGTIDSYAICEVPDSIAAARLPVLPPVSPRGSDEPIFRSETASFSEISAVEILLELD
jgi:hypothetical protein